jgi:hypothetical protein
VSFLVFSFFLGRFIDYASTADDVKNGRKFTPLDPESKLGKHEFMDGESFLQSLLDERISFPALDSKAKGSGAKRMQFSEEEQYPAEGHIPVYGAHSLFPHLQAATKQLGLPLPMLPRRATYVSLSVSDFLFTFSDFYSVYSLRSVALVASARTSPATVPTTAMAALAPAALRQGRSAAMGRSWFVRWCATALCLSRRRLPRVRPSCPILSFSRSAFYFLLVINEQFADVAQAQNLARVAVSLAEDATAIAENKLLNLCHSITKLAAIGGEEDLRLTFGEEYEAVFELIKWADGLSLETSVYPAPILLADLVKISPGAYETLAYTIAEDKKAIFAECVVALGESVIPGRAQAWPSIFASLNSEDAGDELDDADDDHEDAVDE